jgi:hypothetical protein
MDTDNRPLPRNALSLLVTICLAAFAVRMAVLFWLPSIVHQDETFQYLEQAHRLVFGTGLVPWEYIVGARSWIFPGLIAGVVQFTRPFGDSPETARLWVGGFMSLLSLAPVVCGFLWGWRARGMAGAIAAGVLNGFWFELVYFSGHTLSEVLAANALMVGLYLAYPAVQAPSRQRFMVAGVFLGLAFVFRVQLVPAIALGVIAICGREVRLRYLPLLLGAALPVLFSGLLDWLTWDWPFQSMALNFWINLRQGVASEFSQAPVHRYLSLEVTYWSGAFLLVVGLACAGARRLPVLLLVALTIVVAHTLLAHKEYRFIYPALPLIVTLAGIGSAELAARLWGYTSSRVLVGLALFWIATSAILARGREFYPLWFRDGGSIAAMRLVNADSDACGVGIYPAEMWDRSGGYSRLKPGVPLYGVPDQSQPGDAFDYLIGYKPADFTPQGFVRVQCWSEPPGRTIVLDPICLWHRTGICVPDAAPRLTATPPEFLAKSHPEWFDKTSR